jgi:para-aminobenzoate synthetase component 1
MLELHEPDGAFERIESWLREKGFFAPGGESLVADLYLGYGLSSLVRREATLPPPEPCLLPLAACAVRSLGHADVQDDNDAGERDSHLEDGAPVDAAVGAWTRTWEPDDHRAAVRAVRAAIARGDVYQVNLVQHLSAPFSGAARSLAARLRPLTQSSDLPFESSDLPFGDAGWRVLEGNGWAIVTATPELFLARRGQRVWTKPIKGTRPLGRSAELLESPKDAAENVMIVDLERNDLSRVCAPGTVRWPELMESRTLAGVEHLVSTVEGVLRPGVGLAELLRATFPGGSVTGAPKIAAVDLIAGLEPVGRGASMGALGRVHGNGDLELALTIRTFVLVEGVLHLWVGGGVVWDSDPAEEVEESLAKAAPLLDALGAPLDGSSAGESRKLTGGRA